MAHAHGARAAASLGPDTLLADFDEASAATDHAHPGRNQLACQRVEHAIDANAAGDAHHIVGKRGGAGVESVRRSLGKHHRPLFGRACRTYDFRAEAPRKPDRRQADAGLPGHGPELAGRRGAWATSTSDTAAVKNALGTVTASAKEIPPGLCSTIPAAVVAWLANKSSANATTSSPRRRSRSTSSPIATTTPLHSAPSWSRAPGTIPRSIEDIAEVDAGCLNLDFDLAAAGGTALLRTRRNSPRSPRLAKRRTSRIPGGS